MDWGKNNLPHSLSCLWLWVLIASRREQTYDKAMRPDLDRRSPEAGALRVTE